MTKIYLANGLFSLADYNLNQVIAKNLRENIENIDLFVPQEQDINDKNSYADSTAIYELDVQNVKSSDLLIAVIDGVEIDSGVACEIGIATALNIPVIALYTDVRQHGTYNDDKLYALFKDATENQFMYRNLFVVGAVKSNGKIVNTLEDLITEVQNFVTESAD